MTARTYTSTDANPDTDELTSLAIALGGVWSAVLAISLFAPDLVSGSEQQHLPVAAFGTWIWGTVATGAVLGTWGRSRRRSGRAPLHRPLALVVAAVWAAAALVAVLSPEMVTGSDPTRLPLGALLAPVAAAVLTLLAGTASDYVGALLRDGDRGPVDR